MKIKRNKLFASICRFFEKEMHTDSKTETVRHDFRIQIENRMNVFWEAAKGALSSIRHQECNVILF